MRGKYFLNLRGGGGGGRGNILEKFWRKMTPWALNPDLEIHPFDLVTLVKTKNSGRLLNDTFSVFRQNIKKKQFLEPYN